MIAFLQGKLVEALPTQVIVDVNGVGYEALIPLSSFDKLPPPGGAVKLLTQLIVREDAHILYGFMTAAERDLFRLLIHNVSGIGPKTALNILSGMNVVASPFLNWNDNLQQQYGISDEVYEWLPQQTLGLLRASSSPRYVIYCYGQTLRPAVNGEVLNGSAFGLYTNYQITAETAARVVLRLVPHATATGTNYQSVIESFNPLPPN
jgi:hypothetical protein